MADQGQAPSGGEWLLAGVVVLLSAWLLQMMFGWAWRNWGQETIVRLPVVIAIGCLVSFKKMRFSAAGKLMFACFLTLVSCFGALWATAGFAAI